METGMQAESRKNAKAAAFLTRSALCLLILPAACLVWALQVYPTQDACWLCFALAIYTWPFAGVLFVISAGLHSGGGPRQRRQKGKGTGTGWRQAHSH
jgi:hypothetical protein